MTAYQAYMRSAAWRAKRRPILARSRGLCERCRLWPAVNVHHLTYANLGNESPADLVAVCSKCHKELHG